MATGEPITAATVRRAYGVASEFFVNGMDCDDLAQEALIGALEARRDWRPTASPFSALELVCMRRRLIDVVRAAATSKRGDGERTVELPPGLRAHDDVQTAVESRATIRALIAAYWGLSKAEGVSWRRYVNDVPIASKHDDNARYRAIAKLRAAA